MGTLAGEIKSSNRRLIYLGAILTLIPMAMFLFSMPLFVSLSLDDDWRDYKVGYYTTLARVHVGTWLQYCILFAATIAFIGMYNGIILYGNVSLHYLIETSNKSNDESDTAIASLLNSLYVKYICFKPFLAFNNNKEITLLADKVPSDDEISSNQNSKREGSRQSHASHGLVVAQLDDSLAHSLGNTTDPAYPQAKIKIRNGLMDISDNKNIHNLSIPQNGMGIKGKDLIGNNVLNQNLDELGDQTEAGDGKDNKEEEDDGGVRRIWILVNLGIVSILVWWPFELIIKAEMLVFSILEVMTVLAFVLLRWRLYSAKRKTEEEIEQESMLKRGRKNSSKYDIFNIDNSQIYRIPCGILGILCVTIPPICVHVGNIYVTVFYSSSAFQNVMAAIAIIGFGVVIDIMQRFCGKLC